MPHPRIVSLGTAVPPTAFSQAELLALSPYTDAQRRAFFTRSGIASRYLYLDKARFRPTETADELNARFRRGSVEIGCQAIRRALGRAGWAPRDIDFVATTTCTGRLCPHLDA